MAKLKNLQRRMRVFNLERDKFLQDEGKNGLGKPESLTLLPLALVEVDEEVLKCREVALSLRPKSPKKRPTLRVIG